VVAEGHGWFLRRYDGNRALQFLQFLEALPAMTIVPFDSADLKSATKVVQKFSDQSLTLADAHGLVIMTARGVPICWSMDRHLSLTGVKLAI
jgi:predicted nucleic acid-binding protein